MLIVEKALRNLETNTGIKAKWETGKQAYRGDDLDGQVMLEIDKQTMPFNALVRKEPRRYQLDSILETADTLAPLIVIAEHIFPTLKTELRNAGVGYIDGAGNIHINYGGKLIWIEGQKMLDVAKSGGNRAFTKAGLKVVYALLQQPDALNLPYRELAQIADVAIGTVNIVLNGLKEAGFLLQLNKKEMTLRNRRELLEKWVEGYRNVLKPALLIGAYQINDFQNWKELDLPEHTYWGGEPAGALATGYLNNPEQLTVYTAEPKSVLMKRMRLVPKANGNVWVYQVFWKDMPNRSITPHLITYADLIITDDPRCIETAEMIYNDNLKARFE